ncbi:type III polyketide synthase [Sphingomonas lycopersici]|uniref:Type III polyketide synthase n=1 Tax=Sphingomonas lycopersici TaxID=2951807 RepID=A0AA41ZHV8_9SPHN|nr:type III polyketide synthase [Sphingomonas lycopersici]MCW6536951.1 type III polyketide synthase [Sphingomonas lycopersici]
MTHPRAYIHAIGTATPAHDFHAAFLDLAVTRLSEARDRALFSRMAKRSGIEHRWTILPHPPGGGSPVDPGGFYHGETAPSTARRMEVYAREAPGLALAAIDDLRTRVDIGGITHLVVASCTGFVAPGIDQIIAGRLGLGPAIERTLVGFMGCYAAVSALRVAHHIARSDRAARVLVVAVELSSLHLGQQDTVETLLAALQFADGAAAALVCAEPGGCALDRFFCATLPDSADLIRWIIGDEGFEMTLSGEVPHRIVEALREPPARTALLNGRDPSALQWAIHPGGRSILDAVEGGLGLAPTALTASRGVLARFGNMSSPTLMFVLAELMRQQGDLPGVAIAFGPGLAMEGFGFEFI